MANPLPPPDAETAAIEAATKRARALSDAAASAANAHIYDLSYIARAALRETERIADAERDSARKVPKAAARLRLIGDAATRCMAQVVFDAARTMVTRGEDG